jgi:hypothetical protein
MSVAGCDFCLKLQFQFIENHVTFTWAAMWACCQGVLPLRRRQAFTGNPPFGIHRQLFTWGGFHSFTSIMMLCLVRFFMFYSIDVLAENITKMMCTLE